MVMKTIFKTLTLSITILTSTSLFSSCQKNNDTALLDQERNNHSTESHVAFVSTAQLTSNEISGLVFMKEEEKLARDVYSALYKKWGSRIFSNITLSENTHMNEVISLIKYYNIADTTVLAEGEFQNAELQVLYTQLVAKGSTSIAEAFTTGALIEDLDIKDLTEFISKTTNTNIINVFTQIRSGSYNHINSFVSQLTSLGITYIPTYISQTEFDTIIAAGSSGSGSRGNGSGKYGRR